MLENIIRKLPSFKGKKRLARLIFKSKANNSKDIIVRGLYGCSYKIPNIKEAIGFEIFVNGIYEKETTDLIIHNIPLNGVILDIGANIGAVIIPVCKLRKDIRSFCVEASLRMAQYLQENISRNKITNCKIYNQAIGAEDGLSVSFFHPEELFGKGSMSPIFTDKAEPVETITIDTIIAENEIKNVALIKIDVEGYEYHAFKGGEQLLNRKDAPDILFEFADWTERLAKNVKPGDAQKLLLKYGYTLYNVDKKNKLKILTVPMETGAAMIWASKKK